MNRAEKEAAVEELATQISEAEAIFAIDYRGISVPQAAELRSKLREADTSFRVSKNRLAKLAAAKVGQEGLDEMLVGPTALTFVRGDVAQAAKAITTFSKENDILTFKGGLLGDLVIDEDRFKSIARLPSRDVLNGQLAGVVASPLTGLVRGLNGLISGLAIALGQIAEQGLVGQGAPASSGETASPSEEPSVDDSSATSEGETETSGETPGTPGSEAEDVPVDETSDPNPDQSVDGSSGPDSEGEPSEDNETSQDSENNEE